jgi:uncharacterized protein (UPF0248 family)
MSPSDLHFEPTVRQAFGFLPAKYAFTCRESSPISVLYASGSVEVEVTLDRRSYEIGVEIRRIGENRSFPLHRIVELTSPTEAQRWRLVQTSTPERVDEFVPKLASLLQKYAGRALSGDPKTFARLEELEESDAMRTTRDLQIREVRRLADHEWRCRNYAKMVSILSPIQEELTDSEFARFLYAKKRLEPRQHRGDC